jgi:hypothetical protein
VVHGLTMAGDSVYAWSGPGEADDTNRVVFARAAIDSVCINKFSAGRTSLVAIAALVVVVDLAIHAAVGGPGS